MIKRLPAIRSSVAPQAGSPLRSDRLLRPSSVAELLRRVEKMERTGASTWWRQVGILLKLPKGMTVNSSAAVDGIICLQRSACVRG